MAAQIFLKKVENQLVLNILKRAVFRGLEIAIQFQGVLMRSQILIAFVWLTFSTAPPLEVPLQAQDDQCHPCGPPTMPLSLRKRFVRQEFEGADFRPACISHDDCYKISGISRACCDENFRLDSLQACRSSSNPRRCKQIANSRYRMIRIFGKKSYLIRQGKRKTIRPVSH